MHNSILADGGIIQMCFVTDDLDRTANWLGELLKVPAGPVRTLRPEPNALYKGQGGAFTCRIRFIELGATAIEIIEPARKRAHGEMSSRREDRAFTIWASRRETSPSSAPIWKGAGMS